MNVTARNAYKAATEAMPDLCPWSGRMDPDETYEIRVAADDGEVTRWKVTYEVSVKTVIECIDGGENHQ